MAFLEMLYSNESESPFECKIRNLYFSLSSSTFQTYRIDCVLLKLSTIITMERKSQFMFQELNEMVLL